jgi:hypothetical protein
MHTYTDTERTNALHNAYDALRKELNNVERDRRVQEIREDMLIIRQMLSDISQERGL